MQTRSILAAIVALLMGCETSAAAATVAGQVQMNGRNGAREAVVYLEGLAKAQPMSHAVVDQRDKMFSPHVSVVTRGSTVLFPNDDTVFHNVFAYFRAKKFDLGMYPRGASKQVTFDKSGLVVLLCNVHSDMSAYIMVVDTPYFAVTDGQGHFHIAGVPSGQYTLRAWHESGGETTEPLTVRAGEAPLTLTLARK